jgi:hypothetical protein
LYFQQHRPVSFWLCFFHSYVFSATSPLCFSVCSGLFFMASSLLSVTSPLCFSKKVFFFVFWSPKQAQNGPLRSPTFAPAALGLPSSFPHTMPVKGDAIRDVRRPEHKNKATILAQASQANSRAGQPSVGQPYGPRVDKF